MRTTFLLFIMEGSETVVVVAVPSGTFPAIAFTVWHVCLDGMDGMVELRELSRRHHPVLNGAGIWKLDDSVAYVSLVEGLSARHGSI